MKRDRIEEELTDAGWARIVRLDPEIVLRELATILSLDRPIKKDSMVDQARDWLLESGWPVANDWRPQGQTGAATLAKIKEDSE